LMPCTSMQLASKGGLPALTAWARSSTSWTV
jgi:hypothetical protein